MKKDSYRQTRSDIAKKNYAAGKTGLKPNYSPSCKFTGQEFAGKSHSEATKKRMSEIMKIASAGEKNSQYGTRWIHSLELRISKKIKKEEPLPNGWSEGRKMKF